MNEHEMVNAWLRGLWSPEAEFSLDEAGSCAMSIDEMTACYIEVPNGERRIRFFSPVAPLPDPENDAERLQVYSTLLSMNMPGGLSGGGVLAVDYGLSAIILRLDKGLKGMDGISFANVLGGVISTVRTIRKELYGSDGTEDSDYTNKQSGNIPALQPNWIQA